MSAYETAAIDSAYTSQFAQVMQPAAAGASGAYPEGAPVSRRLNLDQDQVKNGLGQLVLTLVKLLHELLERQAIRRIEAGGLSNSEIEGLGLTLMKQSEEIARLRVAFHLEEADLNLDLGPLGKIL